MSLDAGVDSAGGLRACVLGCPTRVGCAILLHDVRRPRATAALLWIVGAEGLETEKFGRVRVFAHVLCREHDYLVTQWIDANDSHKQQ